MKKEILNDALISSQKEREPTSFEKLDTFPEIVQKYLRLVLKEGIEPIYYARLLHSGEFRTDPKQPWFSIKGFYHYLSEKPAFFWKGKIKPLPILVITARDFYYKGKGEVKIRLNKIIPMGKDTGPDMDKASLLRFISEMPLFPSVFLTANYIRWEEIDSTSARIFIEDEGLKAEGIFTFNEKGEIISFEAERARLTRSESSIDKWGGYYENYQDFGSFRVPTYFVGIWYLPEEDFEYVRFKVESIEFNNP